MATASDIKPEPSFGITPLTVGICAFVAIAGFFLWQEHRAHVLGILPYLLLAACPVVHLLMHGRHGRHRVTDTGHDRHRRHEDDGGQS